MNIIYVQSYPVYHDTPYDEPFFDLANRDKWMPALTCQKGFPAELWAVGDGPEREDWQYDTLPSLPIRMFPPDQENGDSRYHTSGALNRAALKAWENRIENLNDDTGKPGVIANAGWTGKTESSEVAVDVRRQGNADGSETATDAGKPGGTGRSTDAAGPKTAEATAHADELAADLFVLKGMDGGVGISLANEVLIPNRIPFAIIIRGEWYHSIIKHAAVVLYETEWQYRKLTRRSWRFWRTVLDEDKLIRLPKSVDTRHFAPDPQIEKEFDVMVVGKVVDGHRDFQAIFEISRRRKVGVVGGGPMLETLKNKYPEITWFGAVPYADMPSYLNRGKIFFHSGVREHFPLSVIEAAACGVPPVAFGEVIHEDVIPDGVGLRVSQKKYLKEIDALLEHPERLHQMSQSARRYAEKHWNHCSTQGAITGMVKKARTNK